MIHAEVVGPWGNDGEFHVPQIKLDYNVDFVDVTAQPVSNIPPTPNLVSVEVKMLDQSTLDQIEADPAYSVLWSEES